MAVTTKRLLEKLTEEELEFVTGGNFEKVKQFLILGLGTIIGAAGTFGVQYLKNKYGKKDYRFPENAISYVHEIDKIGRHNMDNLAVREQQARNLMSWYNSFLELNNMTGEDMTPNDFLNLCKDVYAKRKSHTVSGYTMYK